jgi:hypothetical protein
VKFAYCINLKKQNWRNNISEILRFASRKDDFRQGKEQGFNLNCGDFD